MILGPCSRVIVDEGISVTLIPRPLVIVDEAFSVTLGPCPSVTVDEGFPVSLGPCPSVVVGEGFLVGVYGHKNTPKAERFFSKKVSQRPQQGISGSLGLGKRFVLTFVFGS